VRLARAVSPTPKLPKLTLGQTRYDSHEAWLRWLKDPFPPPDPTAPAFESLVSEGCSQDVLVELMMLLSLSDCERLSVDEVKEAEKALEQAADWVRRVCESDWMNAFVGLDSEELEHLLMLRKQALKKMRAGKTGGTRASYNKDDLIASMVRHVRAAPGELHDKEVSTLIAAALPAKQPFPGGGVAEPVEFTVPPATVQEIEYAPDGRSATDGESGYTLAGHVQWRKRHADLLDRPTV